MEEEGDVLQLATADRTTLTPIDQGRSHGPGHPEGPDPDLIHQDREVHPDGEIAEIAQSEDVVHQATAVTAAEAVAEAGTRDGVVDDRRGNM